ncbi:MAG: hypothetical protein PUG60_15695 [Lachnospiraceae bacterium]|nr:hypothetical protein [Lachnospiraceae bacterium]
MERYYSIAGTVIRVVSRSGNPVRMFDGFECKPAEDVLLTLQVEESGESSLCSCYGVSHFACPPGYTHVLFGSSGRGENRLLANEDWSRLLLVGDPSHEMAWMELLAAAFYSRLTVVGGLLMHASAVKYEGRAVVFTAASGTGKTTQAELWKKYLQAEILNGDKVFLRPDVHTGTIHAWGSPWCGSSPYAVNDSAEAAAIVVLAQGRKNEIRRLDPMETLALFTPHVFFPSWDPTCLERMMGTLDAAAGQIPVYYLSCLPDAEAVLLTRNRIFGSRGN